MTPPPRCSQFAPDGTPCGEPAAYRVVSPVWPSTGELLVCEAHRPTGTLAACFDAWRLEVVALEEKKAMRPALPREEKMGDPYRWCSCGAPWVGTVRTHKPGCPGPSPGDVPGSEKKR
jgi:hypothetical protein